MTLTTTVGDQKVTAEMTTAAGKTYLRTRPGPWYEDRTWPSGWGPDVKLIKAVTETGVETRDSQSVHRFVRNAGTSLGPDFCPFGIGPGTVDVEIFARDDGSLVAIDCTLEGSSVTGTMEFTLTADTPAAIPVAEPIFTTFTSPKGYALDYPADWDVESKTKEGGFVAQTFYGPYGEWLCVVSGPRGKDTLNSLATEMLTYLKKDRKPTIDSNAAGKLGAERARVITYHYKDASTGDPLFGVHTVAVHGSMEVVVYWESSADNEKADAVTFGYIRDSFTFTK